MSPARYPQSRRRLARPGQRAATPQRVLAAALVACIAPATTAQVLYRYQDDAGHWVYADRAPFAAPSVEALDLGFAPTAADVTVASRSNPDGGTTVLAANSFFSVVQIAFEVRGAINVAGVGGASLRGNRILEARSETELIELAPVVPSEPVHFEMSLQYIPGRPGAKHRPEMPYRLPFALASGHAVSQAFPSTTTHADPSSRHAVDFVMPIGTGIYAARGGVVIQIADEYYSAGLDPATDLARANIVRVLHDDGTMALYAHLNWNSIRVRPGQRVARGEYIADSGNTGYSTGPHLHFVVQRNGGGVIESIPVSFAGAAGEALSLVTGDVAVAR